ncbi:glycosyltransferase family 2 protein [Mucilaginibacter sp.]|uniref:glycosyltransferase family 2 protein n=1 Tax=Mucilaginibacter sp. TaxID=1882438 RepID=UPI003AFFC834
MADSNPLVSIITPCYNYGRYLGETLQSLINQTYQNWECIVVNDGSSDNTEEVANAFARSDNRFIYISQSNKGLPGARNTALARSAGKYIQLLDADDFLEVDKLRLQVELLEANKSIDFVYSEMLIFSSEAKERVFLLFKLPNDLGVSGRNELVINALIIDTFFLPGCVIFRRLIYETIGGFNETLYGLEDWEYWSRTALSGFYFHFDDRPGTHLLVRDHDSNMSKVRDKMLLSRIVARNSIIDFIALCITCDSSFVNNSYITKLLSMHRILLSKEIYEYNIHYGDKVLAIKELIKYSIKSRKPFYPIYKVIRIIQSRLFKSDIN